MKIKSTVVFALVFSIMMLSGCVTVVDDKKNDTVSVSKEDLAEMNKTIKEFEKVSSVDLNKTGKASLANPASKFCEDNGGESTIKTEKDGSQVGICKLDTGVECEEWAYVKGDCPKKEDTKPKTENTATKGMAVKEYVAGELIEIKPKAKDADNDAVTFTFTAPLDKDGKWQTKEGDEGEYVVTITASDGKAESTMKVKLVVFPANHAPIMDRIDDITVTAGDEIKISPVVKDADNDPIKITYSGFFKESEYTTTAKDVGEHELTVTASDGKSADSQVVGITVLKKNAPPTIDVKKTFDVVEGELLKVKATASDEDKEDTLVITYSAPLEEDGTWQTKVGDVGTYTTTVKVTDGKATTKKSVVINVAKANSAPVITLDDVSVIVNKGDVSAVKLSPKVTDKDGDKVEVTYSGWMTKDSIVIAEKDEGKHKVLATASDGKEESSVEITVTVIVNNPPQFEI